MKKFFLMVVMAWVLPPANAIDIRLVANALLSDTTVVALIYSPKRGDPLPTDQAGNALIGDNDYRSLRENNAIRSFLVVNKFCGNIDDNIFIFLGGVRSSRPTMPFHGYSGTTWLLGLRPMKNRPNQADILNKIWANPFITPTSFFDMPGFDGPSLEKISFAYCLSWPDGVKYPPSGSMKRITDEQIADLRLLAPLVCKTAREGDLSAVIASLAKAQEGLCTDFGRKLYAELLSRLTAIQSADRLPR